MEFNFTHFCSPTELPESKNDKDMHTYCVWWVVWWWNWLESGRKGNKSFKKNISKTVWSQILVSWFSAVITNRASILKIKFICVKNMFIIFLQFNCDMLHTINLYTKLVNLKLKHFALKLYVANRTLWQQQIWLDYSGYKVFIKLIYSAYYAIFLFLKLKK